MFQLSVIEFVLIVLGCLTWGYTVRIIKERLWTLNGIFEVHADQNGKDCYTMVITSPTDKIRNKKRLVFKLVKMEPREKNNSYNEEIQ